jgi:bleomycin hydrolase
MIGRTRRNSEAALTVTPIAITETAVPGALTPETLQRLERGLDAPAFRIAQNAVTQVTAEDVALNRRIVFETDHSFSNVLDDWSATNQKNTGRCWMFAGLNLLRVGAMQKMGLRSFEFSQNYTMFCDKIERANYMLEAIIETADRDVDDRTVSYLLTRPISDGGQWNMFVNLVRKHGLVPKPYMPETQSSSSSGRMNAILASKLRETARTLRDLAAKGASMEELRAEKERALEVVYRVLCIHLGTPPRRFVWQWTDKDRNFRRDAEMTPQEFAAVYVDLPLDDYVCLVNDPRPTSPTGRTFTVEYLGNVVEGGIVKYLNVDVALMKELTRRSIVNGEPVWFGCDTGKMSRRDLGIWDKDLYDYGSLYDTRFTLDKASRLNYHESQMTHAMLFTGVDIVDDRVRRWRVENSWGEEPGRKGFFVMNDNWFDEYVFEVAARRSELPPELQGALDQPPIVLPAWDPMGALAQ